MENNNYFRELSRVLRKHNIESGPVENGRLVILLNGQSVGRIEKGAIRCIAPEDLRTAEASEAFQKAVPYAEMVAEYMDELKRAPLLQAEGLEGNFRLLADFGGSVLAGKQMDGGHGMQFVTWDWSYDRSAVEQGHYFHDNYKGAKADFAERSGLVQKGRHFSDEQFTEIYRCLHDTLDGQYELTDNQEKIIQSAAEQIEAVVPDLIERVHMAEQEFENQQHKMDR